MKFVSAVKGQAAPRRRWLLLAVLEVVVAAGELLGAEERIHSETAARTEIAAKTDQRIDMLSSCSVEVAMVLLRSFVRPTNSLLTMVSIILCAKDLEP